MAPGKVTLKPCYKGDTWKGFTVGPVLIDGQAPTTTLVSCKMQFVDKYGGLGYEFDTVAAVSKGLITIDDAATWEVTVEPAILPLDKGVWKWDFETIDSADTKVTLLAGTIRITADITNNNR